MVRQEKWSYNTCLVNAQPIMHICIMVIYDEWLYIKFQLHDVLRFYFISLDHISNQRSIKCAAYMVFKAK